MSKYIGKKYLNNEGIKFEVNRLSHKTKKGSFYIVRFDSGYEKAVTPTDFTRGRVKDYLSPSQAGVGIIGYTDTSNVKGVSIWRNMINRCYNKNSSEYKRYGAKGVFVCDRWKRLDYFLEDISKVDGFNKSKFKDGKIQLDKDIKIEGNKEYSMVNCKFVTPQKNAAHSTGVDVTATNHKDILFFNSILQCARYFKVHRGIIERRIVNGKKYNGWKFHRRCND